MVCDTVKQHFSVRVLLMQIMWGHIWLHKFVSHYISLAFDHAHFQPRFHVYVQVYFRTSISVFQHLRSSSWWRLCFVISKPRHPCQQLKKWHSAMHDTVSKCSHPMRGQMQAKRPRKHKAYTVFTAEQRTTIGKYASEYGNTAAVKKFWPPKMHK